MPLHSTGRKKYAFTADTDSFGFQLIPEISSLSAVTTAVPLFSVLTLTAIKYGYDDIVSIPYYIIAFKDYES